LLGSPRREAALWANLKLDPQRVADVTIPTPAPLRPERDELKSWQTGYCFVVNAQEVDSEENWHTIRV
jgi:hypothetical protein